MFWSWNYLTRWPSPFQIKWWAWDKNVPPIGRFWQHQHTSALMLKYQNRLIWTLASAKFEEKRRCKSSFSFCSLCSWLALLENGLPDLVFWYRMSAAFHTPLYSKLPKLFMKERYCTKQKTFNHIKVQFWH